MFIYTLFSPGGHQTSAGSSGFDVTACNVVPAPADSGLISTDKQECIQPIRSSNVTHGSVSFDLKSPVGWQIPCSPSNNQGSPPIFATLPMPGTLYLLL